MGRAVDILVSQAEQHLGWGRLGLRPRPRHTARSQTAALSWVPAWIVSILFTLKPAGLTSARWDQETPHSQALAHTALTVDWALLPLYRDHLAGKVTQLVRECSGP